MWAVGFVSAFVSAFLCVRWLLRYISSHDFTVLRGIASCSVSLCWRPPGRALSTGRMADFRAPGHLPSRFKMANGSTAAANGCCVGGTTSREDCRKALVLYSHGLGGSREWRPLVKALGQLGIGAIALQHPGTDADALAGQSQLAMRHLLRRAADPAELDLRQHDLLFALDRIATTHQVAMSITGHSYGAVSAMRLIGERRGRNDLPADPASVPLSFSVPRREAAICRSTSASAASRSRPCTLPARRTMASAPETSMRARAASLSSTDLRTCAVCWCYPGSPMPISPETRTTMLGPPVCCRPARRPICFAISLQRNRRRDGCKRTCRLPLKRTTDWSPLRDALKSNPDE